MAYCPECECNFSNDPSEETSIDDHGVCVACHKNWQAGGARIMQQEYPVVTVTPSGVVRAMNAHSLTLTGEDMEAIAEHVSNAIFATVYYWDLVTNAAEAVLKGEVHE